MKTIHLSLVSIAMLLLVSMTSFAQTARMDSLYQVENKLNQQIERYSQQVDSVDRILMVHHTEEDILKHYPVREKIEKKMHNLAKQLDKVHNEIKIEQAYIEQQEREAKLAEKRAAVQARTKQALQGETNGHAWVDMGLPSGTKWATCNIGAKDIHGVGTRVAWGETASKKLFAPTTYTQINITDYAGQKQYDLATAQWGDGWHTPTLQQWKELIEYCDWNYVIINGKNGVLFTSPKTYHTIFLPATGYTDDETYKLIYTTYNLAYWCSTAGEYGGAHAYIANYEEGYMTTTNRYVAHTVRAVCGGAGAAVSTTQQAATKAQETKAAVNETQKHVQETKAAVEQAARTVQKTTQTVKEATETFQNLQKIFNR